MKTLHEQIESVQREIGMRQRVYKKWVADGKMAQEKSIHEIGCMEAVLRTLTQVRNSQPWPGETKSS